MLDQVHQGNATIEQVAAWMCDAPARVWDIVNKGRIEVGYDADLILVDLNRREKVLDQTQWAKCGWTPWHGTTLTGWCVRTWVMGRTVFAEGKVDAAHRGQEALFDHARGGYWATA